MCAAIWRLGDKGGRQIRDFLLRSYFSLKYSKSYQGLSLVAFTYRSLTHWLRDWWGKIVNLSSWLNCLSLPGCLFSKSFPDCVPSRLNIFLVMFFPGCGSSGLLPFQVKSPPGYVSSGCWYSWKCLSRLWAFQLCPSIFFSTQLFWTKRFLDQKFFGTTIFGTQHFQKKNPLN